MYAINAYACVKKKRKKRKKSENKLIYNCKCVNNKKTNDLQQDYKFFFVILLWTYASTVVY